MIYHRCLNFSPHFDLRLSSWRVQCIFLLTGVPGHNWDGFLSKTSEILGEPGLQLQGDHKIGGNGTGKVWYQKEMFMSALCKVTSYKVMYISPAVTSQMHDRYINESRWSWYAIELPGNFQKGYWQVLINISTRNTEWWIRTASLWAWQ